MEPRTIYLIESEPDLRRVTRTILEREGLVVTELDSLLPLIEDGEVLARGSLVMTCLEIAPLSSLEHLQKLCELDRRPPVIVLSGAGEERLARASEVGADQVLRKPFRMQELLEAVRAALDRPALQN